ncbi:MAG: beta-carotene hydroxylase [Bacteroidota bacterium]
MMTLLQILVLLGTAIAMEAWAWFMHKYLLHGPLWFLHKSHHRVNPGWFEWNDLVSVLYGVAATACIVHGIENQALSLGIGLGISLYGIIYFLFHDVIIHRRVKLKYHFRHPYVNRLIRAHKIHHKHLGRTQSEAFGFLYAPKKYEVKRVRQHA